MMRAEEVRRRRREDMPTTQTAVNNILAAAAREMEEARQATRTTDRVVASIQTEQDSNCKCSGILVSLICASNRVKHKPICGFLTSKLF